MNPDYKDFLLEILEEPVRSAVDQGRTDCACGEPDCPVGQAIRAEVRRRQENGPFGHELNQVISAAAPVIEKSVRAALYQSSEMFEDVITRGLLRAIATYEKYRRRNALWRRAARGLFGVVSYPFKFTAFTLVTAFHWRSVEKKVKNAQALASSLGASMKQDIKASPSLPVRLGIVLGKTAHRARQRLANRPKWMRTKKG